MPKPTDTWMPFYIADWRAGTARLTLAERGAYLAIIADYWISGPPPDDDTRLALIAGASVTEWSSVRNAVAAKFQIAGGQWRHKRVDAELAKATDLQAQRQARTAAATAARWKANGHAVSSVTDTVTDTVTLSGTDTPSPSPSPSNQVPSPASAGEFEGNGAKAPHAPSGKLRKKREPKPVTGVESYQEVAENEIEFGRHCGLTEAEIAEEITKFTLHYEATKEKRPDWPASLRTWFSKAPGFKRSNGGTKHA